MDRTKLEKLQSPFAQADLEWVVSYTYSKDKDNPTYDNTIIGVSPYIRREAIIMRLNEVLGVGRWQTSIDHIGSIGLKTGIAVYDDKTGQWSWYYDGAEFDQGEGQHLDPVKNSVSRGIRRTAEYLGIGTYLRLLPNMYADKIQQYEPGCHKTFIQKANLKIYWFPPDLEPEFLPRLMTPEQAFRMRKLKAYVRPDSKKGKNLDAILEQYEQGSEKASFKNADLIETKIRNYVKNTKKENGYYPAWDDPAEEEQYQQEYEQHSEPEPEPETNGKPDGNQQAKMIYDNPEVPKDRIEYLMDLYQRAKSYNPDDKNVQKLRNRLQDKPDDPLATQEVDYYTMAFEELQM